MKQEFNIPANCDKVAVSEKKGKVVIEFIPKCEFKRGDILVNIYETVVLIFKEMTSETTFDSYYNTSDFNDKEWKLNKFRLATDEEKRIHLDEPLAKDGKEWDADKMEVVDIDFPKEGQGYYYPVFNSNMYMHTNYDSLHEHDIFRKKHKLCFRTEEEAIAKTKEMLGI